MCVFVCHVASCAKRSCANTNSAKIQQMFNIFVFNFHDCPIFVIGYLHLPTRTHTYAYMYVRMRG